MKFEVGKTYTTGKDRDYQASFTVISRTKKTITVKGIKKAGELRRLGIREINGVENCMPIEPNSGCPSIYADTLI
jgi:hypothetical protein